MPLKPGFLPLSCTAALWLTGCWATGLHAQASAPETQSAGALTRAECTFFGPEREAFQAAVRRDYRFSALTRQVASRLPASGRSGALASARAFRQASGSSSAQTNVIDRYLFQAMADAGVQPASPAGDFEFLRRVTLDLTGRIPTPDQVKTFTADTDSEKRGKYIDDLLARPEWVDKWTMFFGDLLKNTSTKQSTGVNIYPEGRNAFYRWIKSSLQANKPYNQMAAEIISAEGASTFDPAAGPVNWTILGRVTGGPVQDTQDQVTANAAETFLGLVNLNCLLCHNGRGHLDALNLWGSQTTRYQAWQMAAFEAHTPIGTITRVDPSIKNSEYYWSLTDSLKSDYILGSTSGNRPARIITSGKTVAPVYLFNGGKPQPGERYRAAFARLVTGDFQFARATVNYVWKQFFGRGIVEPVNQFDPARLDPDNPPTDPSPQDPNQPWSLQPTNARLLNALAQSFIDSGYDLKALMTLMATSDAYGLSSRYEGDWQPEYEKLFARKLVRRLWAEEIHDAIAQSSGVTPTYKVNLGQDPADVAAGTVALNWAMQLPETTTRNLGGVQANGFLDAFLRGNRDDLPRSDEGSLAQALGLMNDAFVMNRVRTAASGPSSLLNRLLGAGLPDDQLVSELFLDVLSRYPSDDEKTAALSELGSGNRKTKAEDLLWALYNKVDFIFNY